jgi:hypothetical protein
MLSSCVEGSGGDGRDSSPLCRGRYLQTRRQGVRADRGAGSDQGHLHGDDVGGGHQPGAGVAGPSGGRGGDVGGDGGHQRLLEAVLLLAGGRSLRGDVGQRPACQEPPGTQNRRQRRRLVGATGRPRPGQRVVRPARTDPPASRPDPNPHHHHPGTGERDPTAGEAPRGRGASNWRLWRPTSAGCQAG